MIDSGQVVSFQQLAELGRISQPRMTQIMSLLLLAPDIDEKLPLATEMGWWVQRRMWKGQ